MTHSPGPWAIDSPEAHQNLVEDNNLGVVCIGASLPDARLIAAAPELLEALKDAIETMQYAAMVLDAPYKSTMRENIESARAAIAKAEGK